METPTPQQVLDLELPENDSGESTVRGYLAELARVAWDEKRPFGNSGWHYDLYHPMVRAGWVDGTIDDDGFVATVDSEAAEQLIMQAIGALAGRPDEAELTAAEPRTDPRDRLNGLIQAVAFHAEVGVDEHEHVVRTAAEMAAFLADGTVPEPERDDPFGIEIQRSDERVRVIVRDRVIAELDHGQAGNAGLDALEAAVLGAVRACGVEPTYVGPGEAA